MGKNNKNSKAAMQFALLPTDVIYNSEISDGAKLLLMHIYSTEEKNFSFNADRTEIESMSKSFGKCTKSIKTYINELINKEYIISTKTKKVYTLNAKKLPIIEQTEKLQKMRISASINNESKMHKYAENCINMQNDNKGMESIDKSNKISDTNKNIDSFFDARWRERDYRFFAENCPNRDVTDEMYRNVLTKAKKVYDKCQMKYKEMLNGDVNCIYCAVDSNEYKEDCAVNCLIFLDNRGYLTYECFIRDGVKYVGFSNLKDSNAVSPIEQEQENKQMGNNPINDDSNIISLNWEKINREEMQLIQDRRTIELLWKIRKDFKKNDRQALDFVTYKKKNKIGVAETDMLTLLKNMELLNVWKNDYDGRYYFKPIYTRYMQELTNKNN